MQTHITMSQKEINTHGVIARLIAGSMTIKEASIAIDMSTRHTKRLKKKVAIEGAEGLVHKGRGKQGNSAISSEERVRIIALLKQTYPDFGPTFAAEKLAEDHALKKDPKTIRSLMIAEGLWHPRMQKKGSEHRAWRECMECFGEMEQYDGCYHPWFEDRAPKCCLLASIDDATSIVTRAFFDHHEGVTPTFEFWRNYVLERGKPAKLYVDKFSTYSMNHKLAKENEDTLTQFERAMETLGVEVIHARSPEAKGRVERLFHTLQDRLVKELRLAGISTILEANVFLVDVFLPKFNAKFAVQPRSTVDLHKPLTEVDTKHLDSIFSRHYTRVVLNDFTCTYKHQWYQLEARQPVTVCKKDRVTIEEHLDGSIKIVLREKYLLYKALPERPKQIAKNAPWILAKRPVVIPAPNHPWRKYSNRKFANSSN